MILATKVEVNLRWLYDGTETRRFHGRRMVQEQTVGQHSLRVALLLLCMEEWSSEKENRPMPAYGVLQLLRTAVLHDLAEQVVGDLPRPTIRELGVEKQLEDMERSLINHHGGMTFDALSLEQRKRFNFADCLDGMMTCVREHELGNTTLTSVYLAYLATIKQMVSEGNSIEAKMLNAVETMWRRANGES